MGKAAAMRSAARARRAYGEDVAYERITIDPNRMSGLPCIRDTRVTVSAVLGELAAGLSFPELLADFPYLDRDDVLAALEFAAAAVQERELPRARRHGHSPTPATTPTGSVTSPRTPPSTQPNWTDRPCSASTALTGDLWLDVCGDDADH